MERCEATITDHLERGIRPLAFTDDDYPPLLRHIPDPPPVLFAKGNVEALKVLDAVAIVGTRNATPTGLQVTSRIARFFAGSQFVVVRGLAKGIDSSAHEAAIETGITVAVLANPLDHVYPAENRPLADAILERGGNCLAGVTVDGFREESIKSKHLKQ